MKTNDVVNVQISPGADWTRVALVLRKLADVAESHAKFDTSNVAAPTEDDTDDGTSRFGGCPECGKCDGYYNVRSDHWHFCHTHRTKWNVAANMFSSWRQETERDWERNVSEFEGYRQVDPVYTADELNSRGGLSS